MYLRPSMDHSPLSKAYDPKSTETLTYAAWEKSGFFNPDTTPAAQNSDAAPFTIMMPPPNATGVLHIGHAMMLVIQDVLTRYHRMKGDKTLWLPGTDHASIATQNKVEKILAEEGISRHDLGREAFLERVGQFVEESRGTIRSQIKKMGSSCDWSRERYTLDPQMTRAVKEMFVRMYRDGLIYRGNRMVNWCPRCTSTLADDEVEHKEKAGTLTHIRYAVKDSDSFITVATTRPETMFGDVAVAVNPDDARYRDLIGRIALLPIGNREIPIIADAYVDPAFGTGALKITPAHDPNDFTIGEKYHLPLYRIIDDTGHISLAELEHKTPDWESTKHFDGMDRMEARAAVVASLQEKGHIDHIEDHTSSVGVCYRCSTVVEPLISLQWFVSVDTKIPNRNLSLKELAQNAVREKEIEIVPARFEKQYFHWIDNLRDWCISRQIWFGHPIPVTYCDDCHETIVATEAPAACPQCKGAHLTPDPDTLDTWFSSGLWTFSTLGWPDAVDMKDGKLIKKGDLATFHPTSVLETGYDILFFWVARMIIMTEYALSEPPFKTVYLHGLVLDKDGKKMSKSRPETSIDPIDVADTYGADAVRLAMLVGVTPGNDVRVYQEKIEGYRNFVNKLWNVARFIIEPPENTLMRPEGAEPTLADRWIVSRASSTISAVSTHLEKYEFSLAAEKLRTFMWDDIADWYLEIAKIEGRNTALLHSLLDIILSLWHPFIPFVTEVLHQHLRMSTGAGASLLMMHPWPSHNPAVIDAKIEQQLDRLRALIQSIRNARAEHHIPAAAIIDATAYAPHESAFLLEQKTIIERLARVTLTVQETGDRPTHAIYLAIEGIEVYLPLSPEKVIEEKGRIQREIDAKLSLIASLSTRLASETFTEKAPADLVEKERIKLAEYQAEAATLQTQLAQLT